MAHSLRRTMARALISSAVLAGLALSTPVSAQQRDPAYAAARAAGQVGEKTDGYLGVVGAQPAAVRALADDINIKRRENYTARATENRVTIEQYAITQGCILITRTQAGEKYQAPDGSWLTRGAGAPQLDPRCP